MSENSNTEANAEEQGIKMRYRGPSGTNPDVGALEDNKIYTVSEDLAKRLLISYGWNPSGAEAKAWAENLGSGVNAAGDEDADATGQEAADNGLQEGQGGLGEAQHESEGDPERAVGQKGAGTGPKAGEGAPDEETPAGASGGTSDEREDS